MLTLLLIKRPNGTTDRPRPFDFIFLFDKNGKRTITSGSWWFKRRYYTTTEGRKLIDDVKGRARGRSKLVVSLIFFLTLSKLCTSAAIAIAFR